MTNFQEFNLHENLKKALEKMEFKAPTPIQEQAIPLAMQGYDILGSAQTGTGKTAAFAIPMIAKLMANPRDCGLVLTPTRELALQVESVINMLLSYETSIKTALLIGGAPIGRQFRQLRMRPRIIVGTPGRINDHLSRDLKLNDVRMLVLDETDRMLDMGFGVQIDKILTYLPKVKQTLMFSATLPPEIERLSTKYLNDPKRIAVGATNIPVEKIQQEWIRTTEAKKYDSLLAELDKREGSIIIFVKTRDGAERLASKLCRQNHSADAMHGDLQQRQREFVMNAFKKKYRRIMVATDIASRGLDMSVEHVINYDMPQSPADYIHRIGRTARAGASGCAVNLISPEDANKERGVRRLLNPEEFTGRSHQQQNRKFTPSRNKKPYQFKNKSNFRPRHGDRPSV